MIALKRPLVTRWVRPDAQFLVPRRMSAPLKTNSDAEVCRYPDGAHNLLRTAAYGFPISTRNNTPEFVEEADLFRLYSLCGGFFRVFSPPEWGRGRPSNRPSGCAPNDGPFDQPARLRKFALEEPSLHRVATWIPHSCWPIMKATFFESCRFFLVKQAESVCPSPQKQDFFQSAPHSFFFLPAERQTDGQGVENGSFFSRSSSWTPALAQSPIPCCPFLHDVRGCNPRQSCTFSRPAAPRTISSLPCKGGRPPRFKKMLGEPPFPISALPFGPQQEDRVPVPPVGQLPPAIHPPLVCVRGLDFATKIVQHRLGAAGVGPGTISRATLPRERNKNRLLQPSHLPFLAP